MLDRPSKTTIQSPQREIGGEAPARMLRLTAAGSLLGAIAASSCCVAPLLLFSLGASGAWISALTALAPYHAYFITGTLLCLGGGYWLAYRRRAVACREGAACRRPLPNAIVMSGLILATVLTTGAIGVDLFGSSLFGP